MPETKFDRGEDQLFEMIGVSRADRQLAHDLAKHAAEKAVESIHTVAQTAPDLRTTNVIMVSACQMVGYAAEKYIEKRTQEVLDRLPDELRRQVEAVINKPEEPSGQRDFDGKFR